MIKIKNFNITRLQQTGKRAMIAPQPQKTVASRGKLNKVKGEHQHADFNRAFFVRNIRTPEKNNQSNVETVRFISMVRRKGQRLIVGCFPLTAVFHPFTSYRQVVESLAEDFINQSKETATMLYLFKAVSRLDLRNTKKPFSSFPCYTLRIYADSLEQAKTKVCPHYVVISITEQNHSLPNPTLTPAFNSNTGGAV